MKWSKHTSEILYYIFMQAAFWAQTIKNQNLGQLWKALKVHCLQQIFSQDLILCANINKLFHLAGTQTGFILTYRPKNCFKMSCDILLASAWLVHLFYLPVYPGAKGIHEWGKWKALVQGTETRGMCVEGFQYTVGRSSEVPWGSGGTAIRLSVLMRRILPNTVE